MKSADSLTTTPATASGTGDIAIGDGAFAQGGGSVVIGDGATTHGGGQDYVAIGKNANTDYQGVAIGADAYASFSTIAIGRNANVGNYGTGIGWGVIATFGGDAFGRGATTANNGSAFGASSQVTENFALAVGNSARATSAQYALALGAFASATGSYAFDLRFNNTSAMTATTASQAVNFHGAVTTNVNEVSAVSNTGSIDCSLSNFYFHDIQAGVDTYFTATNIQVGQTITLKLTQDSGTAGTISWNTSIFKFEGGTPFTASTGTSEVDIVTMISFDGSTFQVTGLKNFSYYITYVYTICFYGTRRGTSTIIRC